MRSAASSLGHLPAIDGLRGIAILLVLWYHAPYLLGDTASPFSSSLYDSVFWRASIGGWVGVDLFFVISGFLITTILLRTRANPGQLRVFFARRALRILPLAYLYLIVLALVGVWVGSEKVHAGFGGWAWYACHLGNVHIALNGYQPLPVMILWSLAVEEQFYLVWPFIVRLLEPKRLLRACVVVILLSPLIRSTVIHYPAVYVLTLCHADGLAAGAALAVLLNHEAHRALTMLWCRRLLVPALLMIGATIVGPFGPSFGGSNPAYFTAYGYTWLALAMAIVVGAWVRPQGVVRTVLANPVLTGAGKRCYGLYVWHCLCGVLIQRLCATGWFGDVSFHIKLGLWLVLCATVACLSWIAFEQPLLKLKRLFPHAKSTRLDLPARDAFELGASGRPA